MNRYVVLREIQGQYLPLGLAVERDHDVLVVALDEFGLPKKISEPYEVLQRDLSVVRYLPGEPGYFEQVLIELQRHASLSEIREIPGVNREVLIDLINDEVVKPRVAAPRQYRPVRGQRFESEYLIAGPMPAPDDSSDRESIRVAA